MPCDIPSVVSEPNHVYWVSLDALKLITFRLLHETTMLEFSVLCFLHWLIVKTCFNC